MSFSSFIGAGFECTFAKTDDRNHLDMLKSTKHDRLCREDYRLIKKFGIRTVREGLAWNQIDRGTGKYDFGRFEVMMAIAKDEGIQQIWDLNHFDYPDDLDPFSEDFVVRFADYAKEAIKVIRRYQDDVIYIVPINEISFFAWIGADRGWWAPYRKGSGNGLKMKKQLVKAAIAAMDAIWTVDNNVRFIQVDPYMRRLARTPANKRAIKHAAEFNEIIRHEAWDMLAGTAFPELGGNPKYLDIFGVNYYIHNQEWVLSPTARTISHQMMDWRSEDRISFAKMLEGIYERYQRPMYVSETGSFGRHRGAWWKRTLSEVSEAIKCGLPVLGLCAYPTLDRPASVNYLLPQSGIFDFDPKDESCQRLPHLDSLVSIKEFIATGQVRSVGWRGEAPQSLKSLP